MGVWGINMRSIEGIRRIWRVIFE
jgi:hypothetical protein